MNNPLFKTEICYVIPTGHSNKLNQLRAINHWPKFVHQPRGRYGPNNFPYILEYLPLHTNISSYIPLSLLHPQYFPVYPIIYFLYLSTLIIHENYIICLLKKLNNQQEVDLRLDERRSLGLDSRNKVLNLATLKEGRIKKNCLKFPRKGMVLVKKYI